MLTISESLFLGHLNPGESLRWSLCSTRDYVKEIPLTDVLDVLGLEVALKCLSSSHENMHDIHKQCLIQYGLDCLSFIKPFLSRDMVNLRIAAEKYYHCSKDPELLSEAMRKVDPYSGPWTLGGAEDPISSVVLKAAKGTWEVVPSEILDILSHGSAPDVFFWINRKGKRRRAEEYRREALRLMKSWLRNILGRSYDN